MIKLCWCDKCGWVSDVEEMSASHYICNVCGESVTTHEQSLDDAIAQGNKNLCRNENNNCDEDYCDCKRD